MDAFTIFIVWCYIGAGSAIVFMPLIGDKDDFAVMWHMFKHHDITSKIVVGSKFAGLFLLFSVLGLLTTIFLAVIYCKQRKYQ